MNDTSPQILSKMEEMFQQKTPSERFRMGCSMFDLSRRLVKGAILRENAHLSDGEVKREIFLKFYRNDFDPEHQKKIVQHFIGLSLTGQRPEGRA